jgi:PAS domain S-box-containing protein
MVVVGMTPEPGQLDELTALRLLVDNSTDLLTRHAPDGTYLYASPACRTLLGYEPDELVGRPAYDLFHPDDIPVITQSHTSVLTTTDLSTVTYRIRHKDGHYLWFETTSHTVRDPDTTEVVEIQTSSRDITIRMDALRQLSESERRFRLAMANAPIGMALVGLDGSFLEVNRSLCELVGRSEEELRALTFQDITHPDDLDLDLAYAEQLLAGDISHYSMEKRYRHADGHYVWIVLDGSVVRDEGGAPVHFIAQITDVSERKRAEAELREANRRLERSNAELQRFAAVASHDLRTPLTTMQGFLELLAVHYGAALDAPGRDFLARTRKQAGQLSDTVDALLTLARAGTEPLTVEVVDLTVVLADVTTALAPAIAAAGATIAADGLPKVTGDPSQVRLLFQNLVANALKYREPERPLEIVVGAVRDDDRWRLTVDDNGIGLDLGDHDRIFEIFARGARGQRFEGSGIGLATCRRIVERHGGQIRALPLDSGTRFEFTLPAG